MIPCNGNRAYKYYLEGDKVNGKRKRLCFRDDQGPGCDRSEGTVRRAGEANRSSGNIQNPMTGEDRELGELRPLFADAITRWQYRFGSGLGIGCAVFMSCLLRTNSGFADRVLTTLVTWPNFQRILRCVVTADTC